jgi:molecular chaperone GrpE
VEKFAVREIDPLGEPVDPQLHQAMSAQEREGVAAGTVLQVVQKGYLLNERLVRPALVIVAK